MIFQCCTGLNGLVSNCYLAGKSLQGIEQRIFLYYTNNLIESSCEKVWQCPLRFYVGFSPKNNSRYWIPLSHNFSDYDLKYVILKLTLIHQAQNDEFTAVIYGRNNTRCSCHLSRRPDTQNNDIQHNDTQHNSKWNATSSIITLRHNNIQHTDIQHNDIQPSDIQHNNTQQNDIPDNGIQHNDMQA